MTIPKDTSQLENARRLRREMTPHERKLWYLFLRKYPVKIYKQRIIGKFIVDFYCASAKVVCANKLILPFKTGRKALSVTFGDSSPRGRAKASACNCAIGHNSIRNGAHLYRYAPLTVLRTPRQCGRRSFLSLLTRRREEGCHRPRRHIRRARRAGNTSPPAGTDRLSRRRGYPLRRART